MDNTTALSSLMLMLSSEIPLVIVDRFPQWRLLNQARMALTTGEGAGFLVICVWA